jgi:hypothetical protein
VTKPAAINLRALAIGVIACGIAYFDDAAAETLVYRFEAERRGTLIAPPSGSVAALAAAVPRLSGTFGFETSAPVASDAGISGQVPFATYSTGFITVDAMDIGRVAGEVIVQVTDGVTRIDDPRMTIIDEVSISTHAISTDAPIDAITLRLQYVDAERLESVVLPEVLNLDDIAETSLIFSVRVDSMSNRAEGQTTAVELLGIVHFDITVIERVE